VDTETTLMTNLQGYSQIVKLCVDTNRFSRYYCLVPNGKDVDDVQEIAS